MTQRQAATGTVTVLIRQAFVFFLAVVTAGCALNDQGDREVSAVLLRQEQTRLDQAALYAAGSSTKQAATASTATQAAPPAMEPTVLRDYIALALAENPDLKAARQTAYARAKRLPQVTALPDPMIATRTYSPNRPMMLPDGNNVFAMSVTQQLPNPEKLDRAGRLALEETRMALAELEQARLRVIADVKRAYFHLYTIGKSIEITRTNQELLRGIIDVVRSQVEAGKRTQDEVLRIQVEYSDLDRELIDLR